ncbi:hypothetical protein [Thiomonas sp.]
MRFEAEQFWKTRGGSLVYISAVNLDARYPVLGWISDDPDVWRAFQAGERMFDWIRHFRWSGWTLDGDYLLRTLEHPNDLEGCLSSRDPGYPPLVKGVAPSGCWRF